MTPPPRTAKPAWAIAIKKRREEKVGSQEEFAIQADISQSLVSQIERGVQHPTGISAERFARMLTVLQWTVADFSEATGIESLTPASRFTPPVPPVIPHRETRVTIPDELQRMIDNNSAKYPELNERWVQRTLAAPRNHGGSEVGPQTEDEWLEYWLLNRRWLTS